MRGYIPAILFTAIVSITACDRGVEPVRDVEPIRGVGPVIKVVGACSTYVDSILLLTATATDSNGDISLYEWDFEGDGTWDWSSDSSGIVAHTWDSSGIYFSLIRVSDEQGNADTAVVTIVVTVPIDFSEAGGPYLVVESTSVCLRGSGKDAAFYEWDFTGDGVWDWSSADTGHVNHIYPVRGIWYAKFRVTSTHGETQTDQVVVRVVEQPVVDIGGPYTVSQGGTVVFDVSVDDPAGVVAALIWDFEADGIQDNRVTDWSENTGKFPNDGTFDTRVWVEDINGHTVLLTTSVHVVTQIRVWIHESEIYTSVGESITLPFIDVSPIEKIILYEWDFTGDGIWDVSSSTGPSVDYSYSSAGDFTATLRVTEKDGDTASSGLTIHVLSSHYLAFSHRANTYGGRVKIVTTPSGHYVLATYAFSENTDIAAIWNVETGALVRQIDLGMPFPGASDIAVSPDNKTVVVMSRTGQVHMLSTDNWTTLSSFTFDSTRYSQARWMDNDKHLAVYGKPGGIEQSTRFVDAETGEKVWLLPAIDLTNRQVIGSCASGFLMADAIPDVSQKKSVYYLSTVAEDSLQLMPFKKDHGYTLPALSPACGNVLVVTASGIEAYGTTDEMVTTAACSIMPPDGLYILGTVVDAEREYLIVALSDGNVQVWRLRDCTLIETLSGPPDIYMVGLSRDRQLIISRGYSAILVWRAPWAQ
jgi:hypothetical protein